MRKIGLIGLISLIGISPAMAATTEFSSTNYKIESLNFGTENTLFSTEQSILPVISGEGPQVTTTKDTSVVIKWETDKSSNSIVQYGKSETNLDKEVGQSNELVKSHSVTVLGLEPDTTYYYRVSSKDRANNIGKSSIKNFTTKKAAAVSGVQVTDITLTTVVIAFSTAAPSNVILNYGTTTDYGSEFKEPTGSLTSQHTIRLTGLTQGTTYHFQAIGTSDAGTRFQSDDYVFSTNPIPAVDEVSIKDLTSSQGTLVIKANTKVSAKVIYYTQEPVEILGVKPGEKRVEASPVTAKEHEIKLVGLVGNAKYFYQLVLQDEFGNTTATGETSFQTPKDTIPPTLSALRVEQSSSPQEKKDKVQVLVTWTTDKPATTQIDYAPGKLTVDNATKTPEATALQTNHFVILELRPATTYTLKASSRDHAGNVGESASTTLLTPKKRRTVLQFVIERLTETFGAVFRLLSQ